MIVERAVSSSDSDSLSDDEKTEDCDRDRHSEGYRRQSFLRWIRKNVPGAAFHDGNVLRTNPAVPETNADIDSIPFLYDDLTLFDNRIIYYPSRSSMTI